MVGNIQAYNLRLTKAKRRVQLNAKKYGLSLTKAEVTKQAVIDLRLRSPEWMRKVRNMVKEAIRAQGVKISQVKSSDIDEMVKEYTRQA